MQKFMVPGWVSAAGAGPGRAVPQRQEMTRGALSRAGSAAARRERGWCRAERAPGAAAASLAGASRRAELQIWEFSPGRVNAAGRVLIWREDGFDYVLTEQSGAINSKFFWERRQRC